MTNVAIEAFGESSEHWQIGAGSLATGFVESRSYTFRTPEAGQRLFLDDVELQASGNDCSWQAGFYAGRVRAELVAANGQPLAHYQLDVGPTPDKLGQPLFKAMIDDLLAFQPALLLGVDAGRDVFDPDAAGASDEVRFARLRQHAEACLRAWQAIPDRPISRLHEHRRLCRPHQLRRIDRICARQIAHSPLLTTLHGVTGNTALTDTLLSAPFTRVTLDNDANRAMAWMLHRLSHQIARLTNWLRRAAKQPQSELAAKCPRRLEILARWQQCLQRLNRAQPFAAVTRAELSSAGLTAISAHPVYARAYRLAWQALQAGVGGKQGTEALPISPTWQVYERWCFLALTRVLREMYPEATWRIRSWGELVDQIEFSARVADFHLTACLQPRFPAWDQPGARARHSLSRERIPDITVSFDGPVKSTFLVLDAKYRASRVNILDAMQAAHTYRDSLIRHHRRPWGAFLLVPRAAATPWLAESGFQHDFGTGIIELAQHGDTGALRHILQRFVNDATDQDSH